MKLPVHELIHSGKQFNVTRERIRQIEARAMAKLRNPVKTNELKEIFQVHYCMLIHTCPHLGSIFIRKYYVCRTIRWHRTRMVPGSILWRVLSRFRFPPHPVPWTILWPTHYETLSSETSHFFCKILVSVCMIVAEGGSHAMIDELVDRLCRCAGRGILVYAYIYMYVCLIYLCTSLYSLA